MKRLALIATVVLAAGALAGGAGARGGSGLGVVEAKGPAFPVRTFVLSLPSGRRLTIHDVAVKENGGPVVKPTLVPASQASKETFGVVLVLDTSWSMQGQPITAAVAAEQAFVARRNPNEQLAAIDFNRTTKIVLPLTTSATKISAALASTHVLMTLRGGEFISLLDPPEPLKDAAGRCRNVGTWPVLVGDPGARDTILSAPIILADYPQVASESPGDFFDATEIDEMLTLRVLTLTDEEKHAMRDGDPRARALLTRTEALADAERRRLHGASRRAAPATTAAPGIRPGMRVRLVPRGRSDIFDIALAGRAATVTSIEEDYEGRIFLAVTIDDDPGQDLGAEGRPGHRFYFRLDEVERLS